MGLTFTHCHNGEATCQLTPHTPLPYTQPAPHLDVTCLTLELETPDLMQQAWKVLGGSTQIPGLITIHGISGPPTVFHRPRQGRRFGLLPVCELSEYGVPKSILTLTLGCLRALAA